MTDFFKLIEDKKIEIPENMRDLLKECKSLTVFDTTEEIAEATTGGKNNISFDVKYDIPGKGEYVEAIVHKVKNGISANYTDTYMRRRDPNTMVIGDDLPTGKIRFQDRFGYPFADVQKETFEWMKKQDLSLFFYFAGRDNMGSGGIAIAPANAAFFCMGLSMLQKTISTKTMEEGFKVESVIYVAPPFRHTHFDGKQIVVHNRTEKIHELYSYNLYPGPSAKKGLYGVLLAKGEKENWITAHCSTVQVSSPYDNITTFMHEGASGGGKSEMLQHIVREPEGEVLIGENLQTKERRKISLPLFCSFAPVTDDMALCHPSIQGDDGKLYITDAENAWFIRTDSVTGYGDDPAMEKLTIENRNSPLLFINIDTKPESTALIWEHIEDTPGKKCQNPRVVVPRDIVPGVVKKPVKVDVRSFGVRTPPFTPDKHLCNYGNVPCPASCFGLVVAFGSPEGICKSKYR